MFELSNYFLVLSFDVSATGPTVPSSIPSQCCAIPFTLNGDVYYGCTDDGGGVGCFYGNREWKLCQQPAGKRSKEMNIYRLNNKSITAQTTSLFMAHLVVKKLPDQFLSH